MKQLRQKEKMPALVRNGFLKKGEQIYLSNELPESIGFKKDNPDFIATVTGKTGQSNSLATHGSFRVKPTRTRNSDEFALYPLTELIFNKYNKSNKTIGRPNAPKHWVTKTGKTIEELSGKKDTSSVARKAWTRDDLVLAINLYCKTPFGRIHVRNPEIIELADKLERTPGSVSYKLANFASIDPSLNRKGAPNVSKLDREVWKEFFENWEDMVIDSEMKKKELYGESKVHDEAENASFGEGETKDAMIKIRIGQRNFREMILSAYDSTCCITGVNNPELLIASHIVPWAKDKKNRLNPMNGLCLNALHDRAFDRGLITLDKKYRVVVSSLAKHELIMTYASHQITMPSRFHPSQDFLEFHRTNIFHD